MLGVLVIFLADWIWGDAVSQALAIAISIAVPILAGAWLPFHLERARNPHSGDE
ncbi:MAG: hypothetical protein ACREIA_22650 [Opitutaceae bacterium]